MLQDKKHASGLVEIGIAVYGRLQRLSPPASPTRIVAAATEIRDRKKGSKKAGGKQGVLRYSVMYAGNHAKHARWGRVDTIPYGVLSGRTSQNRQKWDQRIQWEHDASSCSQSGARESPLQGPPTLVRPSEASGRRLR